MSSALVHPSAAAFPKYSGFEVENYRQGPRLYTEVIKSWQSLVKESRIGSYPASGLPSPPGTTAMTGVSLNQHTSNDVVSQSYYPSKFYPTYTSARGVDVRAPQQDSKSYTHNNTHSNTHSNASISDESQFWSGTRERESAHAAKESKGSESAIATYLQIPSSINDSKGSLAIFAAEVRQTSFRLETHLTISR
jgi:hypothetical protein